MSQFNLRITGQGNDFDLPVLMYQLNSGSDDALIDGIFPVVNNTVTTIIQFDYKFLELSDATAFYFLIQDIDTMDLNTSGYMVIEKLG